MSSLRSDMRDTGLTSKIQRLVGSVGAGAVTTARGREGKAKKRRKGIVTASQSNIGDNV